MAFMLTDALAHAHERGIIHCDLKSANVIVTPGGRCKVLDFGLAKRLETSDQTAQSVLTETGAIAGTPAYMSPEQLRGQIADARADIWALGVMMYEAAAGVMPFRGNTSFELVSAILNQEPHPLPGKVPIALRSLVERCLEKDPEKRYRQAAEVHAALEAIRAGNASNLAAWLRNVRRRRFALAICATVVAVVLVVSLSVFKPLAVRDRLTSLLAPRIESVAVLPLANLSGNPEQDYLADGMTDALITELNKFSGLKRVIGRSSVMRYKNADRTTADIARELSVASLITGAVIRSDDVVRVTIQLINPVTGAQLWPTATSATSETSSRCRTTCCAALPNDFE
jgi:serine/threonine protein kinase